MKDDIGMCLGMLGKHCTAIKEKRSGFNRVDSLEVVVESELANFIRCNKKLDAYLEDKQKKDE